MGKFAVYAFTVKCTNVVHTMDAWKKEEEKKHLSLMQYIFWNEKGR